MPELARTFSALGDPTRLALVRLLATEPRRSSELAAALGASRPATSRHLRVLRQAGLVQESFVEDDARGRLYTLRRDEFDGARGFLDDVERFWQDQLGALKAHAERSR